MGFSSGGSGSSRPFSREVRLRATAATTSYGAKLTQPTNSTAKYVGQIAIRDEDTGAAWHAAFSRVFHRATGAIVAGAELALYPDDENDATLSAMDAGHVNLVPVGTDGVRAACTGLADRNLTCTFSYTQFLAATRSAAVPEGPAGPTVTSITPDTGPTTGDQEVTIAGTGLLGATVAIAGGASVPVSGTTTTEVTCTPPAHAVGTVSLVVTTGAGSDSIAYTYEEAAGEVDPTTYGADLLFWGQFTVVGGRATVIANRAPGSTAPNLETSLAAPAQSGLIVAMGAGNAVRLGLHEGADDIVPARFGDPWPGPTLAEVMGDGTSYDFAYPLRMNAGTQVSATPYEGNSPVGGSAASWGTYWHDRSPGGAEPNGSLVLSVYGTDNADGPTPDGGAPLGTTIIVSGFRHPVADGGDGHLHLRINGVEVGASTKTFLPISMADHLYVGSGWAYGVHQADCDVGEDLVFTSAHDLTKLEALEAAMMAKYLD